MKTCNNFRAEELIVVNTCNNFRDENGYKGKMGRKNKAQYVDCPKSWDRVIIKIHQKTQKRGETDLQVDPLHTKGSSCSFSSEPAWGANSGAQNLHPFLDTFV